jgi:GNAT superfamily N-acetyltransferase
MGLEGDLVSHRLERGCRAFAVCVDDRPAAYCWVSTGPEWIGEIRLQLRPAGGEAYLWNCFTLDPHRRRGMFQALLVQVAARLKAEGTRRLWIAEAGGPAVPALPAAGYRPVVVIRERRWGPVRRLLVTPAREAGPEAVVAARRALSVGASPLRPVPPARRH